MTLTTVHAYNGENSVYTTNYSTNMMSFIDCQFILFYYENRTSCTHRGKKKKKKKQKQTNKQTNEQT